MDNLKSEVSVINKAERAGEVLVGFNGIGMLTVERELIKICERIDNLGINCFLIGGVLLGLVRSGILLEHDKDIDLGVMGDKALNILYKGLEPYYEMIHFDYRGKTIKYGSTLWVKKYFKIDGKYHCLPIEIQAHYRKGKSVFFNKNLGKSFAFSEGRVVWNKKFFETFGTVTLRGASLNTPSPVIRYLTVQHGNTWFIPKEYKDWRYHIKNLKKGWIK